jgi:hypothetical protein
MKKSLTVLAALLLLGGGVAVTRAQVLSPVPEEHRPSAEAIVNAFGKQGIRLQPAEAARIRANVANALREVRQHGAGNSKVDFNAVEIAQDLGLDTSPGSNTVKNVVAAIHQLAKAPVAIAPPRPPVEWDHYYDDTLALWNQTDFLKLVQEKSFSPVKISWEDIGRSENSAWGDRISDVGIWVRKREGNGGSARLALSVRRDDNFRDKVLMVPADKIKIHLRQGQATVEKTLPERLRELGLASKTKDRNVIVSNQFAIVPVPARDMVGAWKPGHPPRAAFTFSIFPYGSTNFVITDVIEGSHEAVVGPGTHQILFANVGGQRAPFTASRAEDRPDLLQLEKELKAQGMDVDVQRYYLIQIPLKHNAAGVLLSNMGTPPLDRGFGDGASYGIGGLSNSKGGGALPPPPSAAAPAKSMAVDKEAAAAPAMEATRSAEPGLAKVAIGTGEKEGPYFRGAGWEGKRAEEPIRVTVVYFVTPVGKLTRADMENFAKAFAQWDSQAIWGGSFVTKESW